MKAQNFRILFSRIPLVMLAMLMFVACKKDDGNDDDQPPAPVNPLVGTYTFIAATFQDDVTIVVQGDTNHYAPGDDAYLFVQGGLLGTAPCDNEDNAALELRSDFTSWYVCLGENNEAQQGTWEPLNDNNVIKLNIAVPASFVVNITNIDLSGNKLLGTIPSLPLPYDTSIPVGDPLPGGGINFQVASVSVEFDKID
jgi:hypothetical protein